MTSKNTSSSVSIEIPEGLADGLRNYWYPLMVSTDLVFLLLISVSGDKGLSIISKNKVYIGGARAEPLDD